MSSSWDVSRKGLNKPDGPQCEICLKRFFSNQSLRTHIETVHEKRRDHVCDQCQKAFAKRGDMVKHIRTVHNNEKRFECDHCHKKFTQSSDASQTRPHRPFEVEISTMSRLQQDFYCNRASFVDGTSSRCTKNCIITLRLARNAIMLHQIRAHLKAHFIARHTTTRFRCAFGCNSSYSSISHLGLGHLKPKHAHRQELYQIRHRSQRGLPSASASSPTTS